MRELWLLLACSPFAVMVAVYRVHVARGRRRAAVWHQDQVEKFLHCSDDPNFAFKGHEWVDYSGTAASDRSSRQF